MEDPRDNRRELLHLLDELDQLAEEQRAVDLRDPTALAVIEEKIAKLRQKIELLPHPK